jgi:hypothetical protein
MQEQDMLKQIEQRVNERLQRNFEIYYCQSSDDPLNNNTMKGQLVNISDSGLSFLANEKYANGAKLDFVLEVQGVLSSGGSVITTGDLSDIGLLRTKGKVVWVKENKENDKFETGIYFENELKFIIAENE